MSAKLYCQLLPNETTGRTKWSVVLITKSYWVEALICLVNKHKERLHVTSSGSLIKIQTTRSQYRDHQHQFRNTVAVCGPNCRLQLNEIAKSYSNSLNKTVRECHVWNFQYEYHCEQEIIGLVWLYLSCSLRLHLTLHKVKTSWLISWKFSLNLQLCQHCSNAIKKPSNCFDGGK